MDLDSDSSKNHDSFFKEAMSHPEVARDFLQYFLPGSLLEKINLDSVKLESDSFVDAEFGKSQVDLLLSLKFNNEDGFVYILIEQQTKPDYLMAFRLLKYQTMIISKYLKKKPHTKNL